MWMQEEEDNHLRGIVNDELIYHQVNSAELKVQNGSGQKQLPLRVYLPHHELISCLKEWVNPQAEEKPTDPLYKHQHWSRSTANTSEYHV